MTYHYLCIESSCSQASEAIVIDHCFQIYDLHDVVCLVVTYAAACEAKFP